MLPFLVGAISTVVKVVKIDRRQRRVLGWLLQLQSLPHSSNKRQVQVMNGYQSTMMLKKSDV